MKFGLAKIHYTQYKLGMEPNATFISAPDETVTRNKVRWESGIGQKIISNTESMPFMYLGREVIVRTIELRMCDIVARLMPIYVLKI